MVLTTVVSNPAHKLREYIRIVLWHLNLTALGFFERTFQRAGEE